MPALPGLIPVTCPLCGEQLEVTTSATPSVLMVRLTLAPSTRDHINAHRN